MYNKPTFRSKIKIPQKVEILQKRKKYFYQKLGIFKAILGKNEILKQRNKIMFSILSRLMFGACALFGASWLSCPGLDFPVVAYNPQQSRNVHRHNNNSYLVEFLL